jgi:hypothetical protein
MELWEGAILIVGGIWLVGYMSTRNQQLAAATAAATAGTSNVSNLTTVTNQAGGTPAVAGESLTPPQPPPLPVNNGSNVIIGTKPIAPVSPVLTNRLIGTNPRVRVTDTLL